MSRWRNSASEPSSLVTTKVMESVDHRQWSVHRFGLSSDRWSSLRGQHLWITGAGSGFGQAMAVGGAAAGARVVLSGRNPAKLQNTISLAVSLGVSRELFTVLPFDLSSTTEIEKACLSVTQMSDHLYALINNAAIPPRGGDSPLHDETMEFWDRMMRINVSAPWFLTRTIFPHMAKGLTARVLFLSSEAGWSFSHGHGPYNVSKAALNNLTGSLAAEMADLYPRCDVQINALVPGEAKTEMNQGSNNSPFTVVSMALTILSHSPKGPNGSFFHRDGRHLSFGSAPAYGRPLN